MPWISPGRPGCYRATSRKRSDTSLRGCISALSARHAAIDGLSPSTAVGPDGAVVRRQIGPKKRQDPTNEPPEVVCFLRKIHTRSRVTASRPTLITPHEAPSQWTERGKYREVPLLRQITFT